MMEDPCPMEIEDAADEQNDCGLPPPPPKEGGTPCELADSNLSLESSERVLLNEEKDTGLTTPKNDDDDPSIPIPIIDTETDDGTPCKLTDTDSSTITTLDLDSSIKIKEEKDTELPEYSFPPINDPTSCKSPDPKLKLETDSFISVKIKEEKIEKDIGLPSSSTLPEPPLETGSTVKIKEEKDIGSGTGSPQSTKAIFSEVTLAKIKEEKDTELTPSSVPTGTTPSKTPESESSTIKRDEKDPELSKPTSAELSSPCKSSTEIIQADKSLVKTDDSSSIASESSSLSSLTKTSVAARAVSPEKKVINLSPIAISNMFKNPPKQITGTGSEVVTKMDTSETPSTTGQLKVETKSQPAPLEFMKLSMALATALKSDSKKKVFCANTNCNLKTDTVFEAPSHARLYFGMVSSKPAKICANCFKKAELFHQRSKTLVKNKQNLFNLTFEIQTASSDAMVDLDSPGNSPHCSDDEETVEKLGDAEMYSISIPKMKNVLDEALEKFDIKMQLENCATTVTSEVEDLAVQFSSLDIQLDQLREKIEGATKTYNDNIAMQSKLVEIGSVNIDSRGSITVRKAENVNEIEGTLSRLGTKALRKAVEELESVVEVGMPQNRSPALPPHIPALNPINRRMAKLIFVKPKEGQDVYAMHRHSLFYWLPAKILKISLSILADRPTTYLVQFQQKVNSRSKGNPDESESFLKEVTGRQLAFKKPSSITLPVGTRIIAKFKDLLNTDFEVDGMLYAGIVAEVPKSLNKYRYLVFFDDGYAQYVLPTEVLPVVESSADVWADVHRNSQEFIREYVTKFPDRHMIRAGIGATFTVELNGTWLPARISDVDGSLMKVQYLKKADVAYEWIYRGSTRLGPLFSRLKTLEAKPTVTVARRHTYSSRKTNFSFEVNRDVDDDEAQNKVAKRSTSSSDVSKIPCKQGGIIRAKNGAIISTVLESEGNMIKIQIPLDCPSPRGFVTHSCSPACAYRYESDKYRKVSPLAIPFYLGWARELSGPNRDKVFYHTPCGVRCGSYKEIHTYITKTAAKIPIDFFSMECNIDCLNEFEPLRKMEYLKDISYGAEWAPISCVNSLDRELPAYMQYITERIPSTGVEVNDDDGFLTCCDCVDDCQDKDKCACWQQTFSGISFKLAEQEGTKLFGYENRRLNNHILSGIYECNRKCKCRSTCFNRVVQNPVKWPIQLFKTVAKGWGVRALHDMPQGSFICVYTGQLLTDAGANEAGIEAGDEYLAELDFIECNEQMKEDYESDTTDIEIEEPGTKSTERLARQNSNGELQSKPVEEPKKQEVAKKSTIQKAVKSTGGGKRRKDSDAMSNVSTATTMSAHSTSSSGSTSRPVARKSGSKNGTSINSSGGSKTNQNSPSVPSPASSKVSGKDSDSDDDDNVHAYSSFSASATAKDNKNAPRLPLREYFGRNESVYIMDAKSMGNFGRYLNHSCDPNVFVQNLFVDTHDPRFPWVAFFTKKDVKAGTELTWDYNYDIGSVPGKTLYCYCLQQGCRGRLL